MPKLIDLTHSISSDTPTWEGSCGFHLHTTCNYEHPYSKPSFKVQSMESRCGIGTHIDAPAHCDANGKTVEQLLLDDLIVPGVMIDISHRSESDNCLSYDDIQIFEATHGKIPKNTALLIYTGWSQHWNNASNYHNDYQFPYIDINAADYLASNGIHSIGIDTLSPDRPTSDFPVHKLLLPKGILIIENLNENLRDLPPKGFTLTIAPLNIKHATEAPARIWATV